MEFNLKFNLEFDLNYKYILYFLYGHWDGGIRSGGALLWNAG